MSQIRKEDKDWMTAITFAEAGEFETARLYMPSTRKGRVRSWIEQHMTAAAYAEEGLHDEALRIMKTDWAKESDDDLDFILGGRGIRMFSGVLSSADLAARS